MVGFENDIAEQLAGQLKQVEENRLRALDDKEQASKVCWMVIGGGVLLGLVISLIAQNAIPLLVTVGISLIICFFAHSSICADSVRNFESSYKNQLVRGIAKSLQPEMKFHPDRGISEELFNSCGHYTNASGIDRYHTEDLFEGSIGATRLRFGELHAEYKTTSTDSKGRKTTSWHTIFEGVMLIADFHKLFNTWVTVHPDNETDGFFGWIGQKIQGLSSSLVKLESPVFEKHFRVNAGDAAGAMYILTPDMQERLLKLRDSLGSRIIVSFQESNVYITAPKHENWFEPNIYVSALSQDHILELGSQMQHYFRIVETLNLNTRIWTKE